MLSYVINLDRDETRRTFMDHQLGAAGIAYERIPAVIGSALLPSQIARHHVDHVGDRLSANEIGCLHSHVRAWEALLATDERAAFIMEDDIHLSAGLPEVLAAIGRLPNVAEGLFKLEASPMGVDLYRRFTPVCGDYRLHELKSFQLGTAAYVVGRQAAAHLLEDLRASAVPADHLMFSPLGPAGAIPRFQLVPAPCIQDNFLASPARAGLGSSIGDRLTVRTRRFQTLRRPIARLVNRIRNRLSSAAFSRVYVAFG